MSLPPSQGCFKMDFNKYIGILYRDKGRDFKGCDCWGLVRLIYQNEFDIVLPSYADNYLDSEEAVEISDLINREKLHWKAVPLGQERVGDVVVLRLLGYPMHVGIVIGKNRMLHIMKGINSVVEDYTRVAWKNRVTGIFRHVNFNAVNEGKNE